MKELKSQNEYQKFIATNNAVLLYFSTTKCNICKVLKPKIEEFTQQKFPKINMGYVNSEVLPDVAAQNRIFSVPTILLIFDRQELFRKSRNISISEIQDQIERPYSMYFDN